MSYHNEAKRAGVPGTKFPAGFLENFIEKTGTPEFENAARIVHRGFARIKEMDEYKNEISKIQLLRTVVEMTNRLAVGDEAFVQDFASTCRLADADCQNNARQIFKALTYSVITDKALKGEDGLNDDGYLLALGRSFFHEQELQAATRDVITHNRRRPFRNYGIEVEVGNAVEIALGRKFGIPAPIQGMGYAGTVRNLVTPGRLKLIQDTVENRIGNKEAFIDFLMNWTPLKKKITENPAFKENAERKNSEALEEYEKAEEAYFAIKGARSYAQEMAFKAAADAYQNAKSNFLRETIERLVDSHAGGRTVGNGAILGSAGASTSGTKSAHGGNEISDSESVYEDADSDLESVYEDALDELENQTRNV
jgi:hypothetical protein